MCSGAILHLTYYADGHMTVRRLPVSVARTSLAYTPLVYRHSGTWDSLETETTRPTLRTLVNC
jgi:hypothetical protein